MKISILTFLTFICLSGICQKNSDVRVIDFVKVKDAHYAEANYFYENNWKQFREAALKKGFIKNYQLLKVTPDSISNFDFILITSYSDSVQYSLSEPRFQELIKSTRPDGPALLNQLKPGEFLIRVFSKKAQTLFSSE